MAQIEIDREHAYGLETAVEKIRSIEPKLRDRYGVTLEWKDGKAQVVGKGVSGVVAVSDIDVRLSLKLGMLLRPLKGKIQEALERSVDKALNGE